MPPRVIDAPRPIIGSRLLTAAQIFRGTNCAASTRGSRNGPVAIMGAVRTRCCAYRKLQRRIRLETVFETEMKELTVLTITTSFID